MILELALARQTQCHVQVWPHGSGVTPCFRNERYGRSTIADGADHQHFQGVLAPLSIGQHLMDRHHYEAFSAGIAELHAGGTFTVDAIMLLGALQDTLQLYRAVL